MKNDSSKSGVIEYQRDPESGRFLTGNSGGGRPRGSRNKLGEEFLDDLIDEWRLRGKKALEMCATREPTQFVKIVANILPKEVLGLALNVNVSNTFAALNLTDPKDFALAWDIAREMIYSKPAPAEDSLGLEAEEGAPVTPAWRAHDD
jgi:hypothetical protein